LFAGVITTLHNDGALMLMIIRMLMISTRPTHIDKTHEFLSDVAAKYTHLDNHEYHEICALAA
jgi:hypothetical protein